MFSRLGLAINGVFRRICPDPFVLAILLTIVTFVLAWIPRTAEDGTRVSHHVLDLVGFWQNGFWNLLAFGMQMCLILVTGHALASSPPVASLLRRLARWPGSATTATMLVGGTAMLLGLLNWGLGLVAGALLARDVGRSLRHRGIPHHYPLLAAAGYLGLLVWHGGLSGSAPLKVTSSKEIDEVFAGIPIDFNTIPFDETVLSGTNLLVTGIAVLIALAMLMLLMPRDTDTLQPIDDFDVPEPPATAKPEIDSLPDLLEHTPWLNILLAVPMLIWLADLFMTGDGLPMLSEPPDAGARTWRGLTPNDVNLLFLALGLLLHGTPRRYLAAVGEAVRGCSGIILQFPLYAGIMGLMTGSGLTAWIASTVSAAAGPDTLPLFTYISAGAVNLFVPSGGGQWAVQGPVAMEAAGTIGVRYPKMVMAVAYGDQVTNMLQPFWALPLLAITGVRARDIVGYTALIMVAVGAWFAAGLLLF